jgi:hypothetical protein
MHCVGTMFTMKMKSDSKILCDKIFKSLYVTVLELS